MAPTSLVGDLTIAQVQTIAIARALSFDLKVLLLNEPTSVRQAVRSKNSTKLFLP